MVSACLERRSFAPFHIVAILLILLLAFGLRIWVLDDSAITADELRQYERNIHDVPIWRIVVEGHSLDTHMAALLLVKSSIMLLGDRAFSLRWPTACLSLLSVVLTFRIGVWLFRRPVALTAALLLTICPVAVTWAYTFKGYTSMLFFVLLAYCLSLRALQTGARRLWYGAAAAWAMAVYTHLYAGLAWTGLLGLALVWHYRRSPTWPDLLRRLRWPVISSLSGILVGLLLVGIPIAFDSRMGVVEGNLPDINSMYEPQHPTAPATIVSTLALFSGLGVDDIHGPSLIFYLLLALAALAVVLAVIRGQPHQMLLVVSSLLLPFAAYHTITTLLPGIMGRERYFSYALPFFLLLVAAAPWELWRLTRLRGAGYVILNVVCLGVTAAFWLPTLQQFYAKETAGNWRAAAAYLAANASRTDLILCEPFDHTWGEPYANINKPCRRTLTYALEAAGASSIYPVLSLGAASDYKQLAKNVQVATRSGRVWLVLFGIPADIQLQSPGQPSYPEWNLYGRTALLSPPQDVIMIEALSVHLQRLEAWTNSPHAQLFYHMRLAQLAAITGQSDQVAQHWQAVEQLRGEVPEAAEQVETARATLQQPALLRSPQ